MNKKVFIVLHCIYLFCSGNPEVRGCGRRLSLSGFGGKEANPGEYPWMVSLQVDGGEKDGVFDHICGASVLSENWIITTAHCLTYTSIPRRYRAVVGLTKLSDLSGPTVQIIKISKIMRPKSFITFPPLNDIGLLKTAEPIDIVGSKGYVNGICLPRNQSDPTGYAKAIGWGYNYEYGNESDTLMAVDVSILPIEACNYLYDKVPYDYVDDVVETVICADKENRDACLMNSGGPLFQTTREGVSTLIGIVSYGEACGGIAYPAAYTKVLPLLPWIDKVIAEN